MSKVLQVSFKETEENLYNYSKAKDFSYYVKELIRKDMNNLEIPKITKAKKEKRNSNFDF